MLERLRENRAVWLLVAFLVVGRVGAAAHDALHWQVPAADEDVCPLCLDHVDGGALPVEMPLLSFGIAAPPGASLPFVEAVSALPHRRHPIRGPPQSLRI
ncbi:hypothetical protein [Solimonas soli]|uniref:hypothetical protein n=1 Tax=Solimonas soli TaxID=413479 RepID=UPI0012F7B95D|nr:hypothetical protein [Solimonas soli]